VNSEDLLKRVLEDNPPVAPEDELLHNRIQRVFDGQRNKAIARLTLVLLLSVFILAWGCLTLQTGSDVRVMLTGVFLLMCGLELNVLMKLWYWVTDNKISVLKELKTTQLMIAQLNAAREEGSASVSGTPSHMPGKESSMSFWERYDPTKVKKISRALIIASAATAAYILLYVV